jgi:hypothetical protein
LPLRFSMNRPLHDNTQVDYLTHLRVIGLQMSPGLHRIWMSLLVALFGEQFCPNPICLIQESQHSHNSPLGWYTPPCCRHPIWSMGWHLTVLQKATTSGLQPAAWVEGQIHTIMTIETAIKKGTIWTILTIMGAGCRHNGYWGSIEHPLHGLPPS